MATRTAAPGLSTDELARIRDTLAAGRKPKVVFTASAGQLYGVQAALATLAVIPLVVAGYFIQSNLVRGLTLGAIKR